MLTEHQITQSFSILPLAAITIPIIAAVASAVLDEAQTKTRNTIAVASTIATLGVILVIARSVFGGQELYFEVGLSRIPGFSIKLSADGISIVFSLVAGVLWVLATLHATQYMSHEEKKRRFFTFLTLACAFTLGVFMVSDFLSLFIFFELMGLSGYFLVVHQETEAARKASSKYLFMTVAGGLTLLAGIFLYVNYAETTWFIPMEHSAFLAGYPLKILTLICLIAGFGVKAGMLPFHVWLPDAHPAAPSPASALLSGVMIKTGAYGIIRTVATFFYQPAGHSTGPATGELGFILVWLALITMFAGMILAVLQSDLKRTLAYSSVSQMGFILLGVGGMALLQGEGAIGLSGSIYHVVNHALFKGCFFLTAGAIVFRTHEINIYKLGGLSRKMPWSTFFWCISALGIAGLPLTGCFISKTLLHHTILEAAHLSHGSTWLNIAEIIFTVSCAGTVLYFLKITYFVFFKNPDEQQTQHSEAHGEVKEAPAVMLVSSGILAGLVIITGLFPRVIFKNLLLPGIETLKRFEPETIEHLTQLNFFASENIRAVILPFSLGIAAFFILKFTGLFERNREKAGLALLGLPPWAGIDSLYIAGAHAFVGTCFVLHRGFYSLQIGIVNLSISGFRLVLNIWRKTNFAVSNAIKETAKSMTVIGVTVYEMSARLSQAVKETAASIVKIGVSLHEASSGLSQKAVIVIRQSFMESLNFVSGFLSHTFGSLVEDITFGTLVLVIILAVFLTLKLFTPL